MITKGLIAFLLGTPPAMPLAGEPPTLRRQNQVAIANALGGRIYLNKAPQPAAGQQLYPYCVVHKVGGAHPIAMQAPTGLSSPRLSVVFYALDGQTANTLGDQARLMLHGYLGTWGTFMVQGCFLEDEGDDYLPPAHVDEIGVHSTPWSFKVWHVE